MTTPAPLAHVELTAGWRIVTGNQEFAALVGAREGESLDGRLLSDFLTDRLLLDRLLAIVRAERKPAGSEIEVARLDGRAVAVVIALTATFGPDGELASLHAVLADAIDTGRLNVLGAQRMEAIGRLSGGIAHDFNNLLMIVSGHVDRLLSELPEGSPQSESAEFIRDAADKAASVTRQLLAFSRRQTLQVKPTRVHELVASIRPSLEAALREPTKLELDLASVPEVRIDASQLEDALVSLVMNACDAMPAGGTVIVRAATEVVPDDVRRRHPWIRPGTYARLVVSDTGHGMDQLTQSRVFEPFFTTRVLGHGAGLGLASVYGFVKQSHGYVYVESEVGKGASFTMLFPVIPPHGAGVFETVLVADENEPGRATASEALRREGYHVLEAPSADRAADVFAAWTARVHLLLIVTSGSVETWRTLVNRLRTLDPLLQVLYVIDPAAARPAPPLSLSAALAGHPHLSSPVTAVALVRKVREVLDTGEGR